LREGPAYVVQAGLELTILLPQAFQMLGLQAWLVVTNNHSTAVNQEENLDFHPHQAVIRYPNHPICPTREVQADSQDFPLPQVGMNTYRPNSPPSHLPQPVGATGMTALMWHSWSQEGYQWYCCDHSKIRPVGILTQE
jgi:hypothetical protein